MAEFIFDVDKYVDTSSSLGVTVHTVQRKFVSKINQISLKDMKTKNIIANSDVSGVLCEIYGIKLEENEIKNINKNIKRTKIIDSIDDNSSFHDYYVQIYYLGSIGKHDIFMDNDIKENRILFEDKDGNLLNDLLITDKNGILL